MKNLSEIKEDIQRDQKEIYREDKVWKFTNNGYWGNYRLSAIVDDVEDSYDKTKVFLGNISDVKKGDIKNLIEKVREKWPGKSFKVYIDTTYYDNKFDPEPTWTNSSTLVYEE